MDDKEIQDIISEQIKNLPQDVKDAVFSVDYSAVLDQITKKNKLMIDQAGKLEIETTLTVVGLEPISDYKKNLMKNVGVDEKTADAIITDVNDLVFKKIRASLQKMNEEMEEENSFEEQEVRKEEVMTGIENPSDIVNNEGSVSFRTLASNSGEKTEKSETMIKGIEINTPINTNISEKIQLPPVQKPKLLMTNTFSEDPKREVKDVIVEKMSGATSLPKESIVIEEASKIPSKEEFKRHDPYREPII